MKLGRSTEIERAELERQLLERTRWLGFHALCRLVQMLLIRRANRTKNLHSVARSKQKNNRDELTSLCSLCLEIFELFAHVKDIP